MVSDDSGAMVETVWNKLPDRFPNIDPDAFIIMPNHIHGTVVLVGAPLVGAHLDNGIHGATGYRATTRVAPTLGAVVGAFKSLNTQVASNNPDGHVKRLNAKPPGREKKYHDN